MKHRGWWLLGGAVAAWAAYEVWFAPVHVPAGFRAINVAPGASFTIAAPSGGVAFVLPKGARWSTAALSQSGGPQKAVPLPGNLTSPILVGAVLAGLGYMLEWTDAGGQSQAAVYLFA
jgi:hypothetical protein